MLNSIRQDISYAMRTLLRAPGFAGVVIFTLALGIGANTAIFSVIDAVLMRPLGFADPDQLVVVWETSAVNGVDASPASIATFRDWEEQSGSFEAMAAWQWSSMTLEEPDDATELLAVIATPNYFSTLGVDPVLGRLFAVDDAPARAWGPVVVLSAAMWQQHWGADPGVIGQSITLDGNPFTVIGVMRPGIPAPSDEADLWIPANVQPVNATNRGQRTANVIGRLKATATPDAAAAEIAAISAQIASIYPGSARDWSATVVPMREQLVGAVRPSLLAALSAVLVLLLIVCVNIANLLLARATVREKEIAIRASLGAGRGRIVRQLLTESMILSIGGGAAGVAVAVVGLRILLALEPGVLPRIELVELNGAVLAFAFGLALFTGLLFGLAPALEGAGVSLAGTISRGGSRGATTSRRLNRARELLVTAQLALTVVLLSGAGLLTRTFLELRSVNPGFTPDGVIAARIFLDGQRYRDGDASRLYFRALFEKIAALPGVLSVGASSSLPMDPMGVNFDMPFRTEAIAGVSYGEAPQADFRVVTAGYFETLGVPLIAGRTFATRDDSDSPSVIVINETMAAQYWPGQNPVGQRLETVFGGWQWYQVVGIVADTRYYGLDADARAEMYVAEPQVPFTAMTVVAKTAGGAASLTSALHAAILDNDPREPANSILPVTDLIADSIAQERFYATLLATFGLVALLLTAAGIYGVLSFWVTQRTQEIGVRMALGANGGKVVRLVVLNGMMVSAVGIGIGLIGAFATGRLLDHMLFGVTPGDVTTHLGVSSVLGLAAFLACLLPALRASHVDPITALRAE